MTTLFELNRSLNPHSSKITLYELDFTTCLTPIDSVLYLTAYRNGTANISFGGQEYIYADIQIGDLTATAGGTLMNPTLTFMAGGPADSLLIASIQGGLRGMRVTRKRTFAKFLDSGDAPDGTKFNATSLFVNGLQKQTSTSIVLNLTPAYGIEGINDIANRVLQNDTCMLKYRSRDTTANAFVYPGGHIEAGACPWGNPDEAANWPQTTVWGTPYYDSDNNVVTDPALDRCSLNYQGCVKRFGENKPLAIEAILTQSKKNC